MKSVQLYLLESQKICLTAPDLPPQSILVQGLNRYCSLLLFAVFGADGKSKEAFKISNLIATGSTHI
jgi:hypothetical protein